MFDTSRFWVLLAVAWSASPAGAETITIRAQGVRFIPDIVQAHVGDTLAFRNMWSHSAESVRNLWPAGVPEVHSSADADYDYVLEQEGLYVIKCPAHWGGRMGVVVAVGDPAGMAAKVKEYEAFTVIDRTAKPANALLKKFRERMGLK